MKIYLVWYREFYSEYWVVCVTMDKTKAHEMVKDDDYWVEEMKLDEYYPKGINAQ